MDRELPLPGFTFAETIGTIGYTAEAPYLVLGTGVVITHVFDFWQGPVRLLMAQPGRRDAVMVWGAPMEAIFIYRQVRLWLRPGERWFTMGGLVTITGDRLDLRNLNMVPPVPMNRFVWPEDVQEEDEARGVTSPAVPTTRPPTRPYGRGRSRL